MPASSKRSRRIKARENDYKQTGVMRKAKRNALDTKNETDEASAKIAKKRFNPHDLASVSLKNLNQERFVQLYYDDTPLLLATGWPGTAKSFLSIYCALSEVFDDSTPYDKLIIVRSAVETRSVGFLPGTLEEKSFYFESPYRALFSEIMPQFKEGYDHCKSLGYVEFMLTTHIRGLSLHNCIVLVEEAQNMDIGELRSVLTRAGLNTRILINGDSFQDDLQRKREKSGLGDLKRIFEKMPASYFGHIHYDKEDIVRSGLVKEFVIADFELNGSN